LSLEEVYGAIAWYPAHTDEIGQHLKVITGLNYAPNLGTIAPMLGTTGSTDKLASVLFGKVQQAVLSLLFGRPDESFYVREIVRATRVGQGAVQRELQRLAEAGSLIA
jgi:hypothetical protein